MILAANLSAAALHHSVGAALKATIVADTNRDGVVDIEGDSDLLEKLTWTADRGALFLANIADTDQRCSRNITDSTPNDQLDKCHDASDNVLRNQKYLASLRTLPVDELSASAFGSISVTGPGAEEKVRIFVKAGSKWEFVTSNYTFTAEELTGGLELGIDGRDVRRPNGWDGKATVRFSITDGAETASDEVALRVAPVLTHHHAQEAERVFSTRQNYPAQNKFNEDLVVNVADAGILEPVFQFGRDIWTQDFFEPGYSSIPGPDGPVVLRIMIRSCQSGRQAGRQVFRDVRDKSVGAVQYLANGGTLDSTGNLETIPPYTHDGKSYPAGRVIMGTYENERPYMLEFLEAQETQVPLELDTAWLVVGHVDEFLQFLPADNERGWVLMADDPIAGLEILRSASEAGHGAEPAFSRPYFPSDEGSCAPNRTIDEELARPNMESLNQLAAERIAGNIEILKRETGLTQDEIIRVPAIFYDWQNIDGERPCVAETLSASAASRLDGITTSDKTPKPPSILEAVGLQGSRLRRQAIPETQLVAYYPGTINGVVLSSSFYLAPNPWGPVIGGEDIFAKAVVAAYEKANYNVTFMDDWFSHHSFLGEIHCGSNTWRNTDAPWW
jgi:protein-arginine deiminase